MIPALNRLLKRLRRQWLGWDAEHVVDCPRCGAMIAVECED